MPPGTTESSGCAQRFYRHDIGRWHYSTGTTGSPPLHLIRTLHVLHSRDNRQRFVSIAFLRRVLSRAQAIAPAIQTTQPRHIPCPSPALTDTFRSCLRTWESRLRPWHPSCSRTCACTPEGPRPRRTALPAPKLNRLTKPRREKGR